MAISIQSPRLRFGPFQMADAEDVFACISLAITRFLTWEPHKSLREFREVHEKRLQVEDKNNFTFVIRRRDTLECLGLASLEGADAPSPELGIWLKEAAHGFGYGLEAAAAVAEWACKTFGKDDFLYSVAEQNVRSRRIAEKLHGEIVGTRTSPKYDSVVYKIPWKGG